MFNEKKLKKRIKKLKKLGIKKKTAKKIAALDETAVKEAVSRAVESGEENGALKDAWEDYVEMAAAAGVNDPAVLTNWAMRGAEKNAEAAVEELSDMIPPEMGIIETVEATAAEREALIQQMESLLESIGDDAQLANVDLQNMLQKQQQTLQLMSNISKMMHDTAMAVIRKIG